MPKLHPSRLNRSVEAEVEGAEFVTLEDADAEATGKKADLPDTGDDIEVEDDAER